MSGRGSGSSAWMGACADSAGSTRGTLRCSSRGTTHVPTARHTTTGSANASAADTAKSGVRQFRTTFLASNAMVREVLPTRVMTPVASMKSPAYTGARNSTPS